MRRHGETLQTLHTLHLINRSAGLLMFHTLQLPSEHPPAADSRGPADRDVWSWCLWTYGPQRAHLFLPMPWDRGGSGLAAPGVTMTAVTCDVLERVALLGTNVDGWAPPAVRGADVHPAAERVHDALLTIDPVRAAVVIDRAVAGTAPDWQDVQVRMLPVLDDRGRVRMVYADPDRRRPIACCVEPTADAAEVEFARRFYATWRQGLADLAAAMREAGFHVTGPKAPARPWEAVSG